MTPTQQIEFRRYSEAMKVDILRHMQKEDMGVYELRRIQKIAKAMIDFHNSYGTFYERESRAALLRDTADEVSPSLHESLMDEAFDGQAALKSLAVEMIDQFSNLRSATEDANEVLRRLPEEHRNSIGRRLGMDNIGDMESHLRKLTGGSEPEYEVVDAANTADEEKADEE